MMSNSFYWLRIFNWIPALAGMTVVLIFFIFFAFNLSAQTSNSAFVNIVNPVRGADFWEMQNQKPEDVVIGQIEILKQKNVSATWLIRYDALKNEGLLQAIKTIPANHEKGLFLEITPTFTEDAGVDYRESQYWHFAESVLLTGYEVDERKKLIDTAFEKFKSLYGTYPKSVGAWWIDGGSIQYMQDKYGINAVLICADQYSTDNYQIWGQYWSTPYYPNKQNALYPANSIDDKLKVVMVQWASRDPVNGYGKGVEESTYSVQANDYIDYHDLDINYFAKLIDIYTTQKQNAFSGQVVVGLENTYDWQKYKNEYASQIQTVLDRQQRGQLVINTMTQFASWYSSRFPNLSPEHSVVADDPLGSDRKVVWFMNHFYRAGWFYNNQGSVFRDVRQYVTGEKEPCLEIACKAVNFATFKTRSLDEVTFQDKKIIDPGKITQFSTKKIGDELQLHYINGAGLPRTIAFLPRDIKIDYEVVSIDGFILRAKEQQLRGEQKITLNDSPKSDYFFSIFSVIVQLFGFILFILLMIIIPGFVLVKRISDELLKSERLFVSVIVGLSLFTLCAFLVGFIKAYWLLYLYGLVFIGVFIKQQLWHEFLHIFRWKWNLLTAVVFVIITAGVIFQSLAVIRSGWVYDFGMGFWGPTGHDHIWHQALNNQLLKGTPPENPIFSGVTLTNYHYFFNVLAAATGSLTGIDLLHLLYRFYPVLFSLLLGIGFLVLAQRLFKNILASIFVLYFVYFGSSFGWIVDYLRTKTFGGESNFWINQPVSFNLNPPFAISMVLLIGALMLLTILIKRLNFSGVLLFILVAGTLIEYKVYAGMLLLAGLFMISFQQVILFRNWSVVKLFIPSVVLSALLFIPQNSGSSNLIVYSPFWFIHAMVDSPDRLGIQKITEARMAYQQRGETLKFIGTEILALVIFIVGNLGTRVIGLLLLPGILLKKVREDLLLSLIIWIIIISFIVPMLFIQKGTPWNTIQFSYYGLYLISLFAGFSMVWLFSWSKRLPRIFGGFARIIVGGSVGLLLVITPISSYATFEGGLGKIPPARLSFGEMEALRVLQKEEDGVVLTYPYDKNMRGRFDAPFPLFAYETSSYVSAFSGKPTFIEDEIQMDIFQINAEDRLVQAHEFFRGREVVWSQKFLADNNIKYVYLPKVFGISLNSEELGLNLIFENDQVFVWKVN